MAKTISSLSNGRGHVRYNKGSTNPVSPFFLAMMAPELNGLNLTSVDFENLPFEKNTDDNSGCESQVCASK